MPRSNFETPIGSVVNWTYRDGRPDGSHSIEDGRFASETSAGTSRRKPKGWLPPTGYAYHHVVYQRAMGSVDLSVPGDTSRGVTWNGCVGMSGFGAFNSLNHFDELMPEGGGLDNSLGNTALIAALGKLKSKSVDLAVAYGERKQTAQLVGDTANRIVHAVRNLKHGRVRDAMRGLGIHSAKNEPRGHSWPKKWLELQYGWKPLLSDIYGACDALSKRPTSDWIVTAKASRSDQRLYTHSWSGIESGAGRAQAFRSAFVRVDAMPSSAAARALSSTGISNPAVLAWELVPFSFVVDWFLPVGSYLESLDAAIGYDSIWVSTSILTRLRWDGRGLSGSVGDYIVTPNWREYKQVIDMGRSVSDGYPIPSLPSFKDPRSLGHMANGLALLAQVFGR